MHGRILNSINIFLLIEIRNYSVLVVHMVSFPVLVVPTSHLVVPTSHLVVLFTYFGRPFYIGSLLVLCTRNFIATPNLKKRSNDTLSLTRLSACLHLTWSSTEPGIFGAVGFCDSKRRSRVGCVGSGPVAEMIHAISAQVRGLVPSILCFLCLVCTSLRATCCCSSTTSLLLLLKYYVARAPR